VPIIDSRFAAERLGHYLVFPRRCARPSSGITVLATVSLRRCRRLLLAEGKAVTGGKAVYQPNIPAHTPRPRKIATSANGASACGVCQRQG